jgi:hypothetical protein
METKMRVQSFALKAILPVTLVAMPGVVAARQSNPVPPPAEPAPPPPVPEAPPTPEAPPAPTPPEVPAPPAAPMPPEAPATPTMAAPSAAAPAPAPQAVYPPCTKTLQDQCTNTRRGTDVKRSGKHRKR